MKFEAVKRIVHLNLARLMSHSFSDKDKSSGTGKSTLGNCVTLRQSQLWIRNVQMRHLRIPVTGKASLDIFLMLPWCAENLEQTFNRDAFRGCFGSALHVDMIRQLPLQASGVITWRLPSTSSRDDGPAASFRHWIITSS